MARPDQRNASGYTIVACATPPGRALRALVRLSGPEVRAVGRSVCGVTNFIRGVHRAAIGVGGKSCPALAMVWEGPRSFTGEDSLELVLPGNPHLVERVVEACCAWEGVRRAGPGEFTSRAYTNGRIGLDQAEGVAALIAARSEDDLRGARALATGETGRLYGAWAQELTTLLALVEAGIDFVDQEDVVAIAPAVLRERLGSLRRDMGGYTRGSASEETWAPTPLVVLVGRPNAGKSTLFNALLGRERSVVSGEVGTTRDAVIETLRLDDVAGPGLAVRLADVPGLEQVGTGGIAGAAQKSTADTISRADAFVHCDPDGEFAQSIGAGDDPRPVLRVRTKADLVATEGGDADLDVCALDGYRLDALRRAITDIAVRAPGGSASVALGRHAHELARASDLLGELEERLDPAEASLAAPEIVAGRLREALDSLEHVLGRVSPDDVFARVFATFCVGK